MRKSIILCMCYMLLNAIQATCADMNNDNTKIQSITIDVMDHSCIASRKYHVNYLYDKKSDAFVCKCSNENMFIDKIYRRQIDSLCHCIDFRGNIKFDFTLKDIDLYKDRLHDSIFVNDVWNRFDFIGQSIPCSEKTSILCESVDSLLLMSDEYIENLLLKCNEQYSNNYYRQIIITINLRNNSSLVLFNITPRKECIFPFFIYSKDAKDKKMIKNINFYRCFLSIFNKCNMIENKISNDRYCIIAQILLYSNVQSR